MAAVGPFTGKPRPAVVVQSDKIRLDSITLCLLTTDPVDVPIFRVRVDPDSQNGLRQVSWVMADKIVTVRRDQVGRGIGRLGDKDMQRLERALLLFLALPGGSVVDPNRA